MNTLVFAIVGHLVGDYLLQNDWMAQNKKRATFPCVVHCLLWTYAVVLLSGWTHPWVQGVLFLTHFAQDRTTLVNRWMRLIGATEVRGHSSIPSVRAPIRRRVSRAISAS